MSNTEKFLEVKKSIYNTYFDEQYMVKKLASVVSIVININPMMTLTMIAIATVYGRNNQSFTIHAY